MRRDEIESLVERREKARADKNWPTADAIRDDLATRGVQVMDREDLWQCGDMVGLYSASYNIKDSAIRLIMEIREEARQAKNFDSSDTIRDMLKQAGIEIKDKEGIWWSTRDGRRGNIQETARSGVIQNGPAPNGAGAQAARPQARSRSPRRVHGQSHGHHGHGDRGAYPAPPAPGAGYAHGHGVGAAYHHPAAPSRGAPPPPPGMPAYGAPPPPQMMPHHHAAHYGAYPPAAPHHQVAHHHAAAYGAEGVFFRLQDFLVRREEYRNARDFAASDKIRDVLEMVGVHLKDKEKRWNTLDGRSGDFPSLHR